MRFLLLTAGCLILSLAAFSQAKNAAKIIVTPSDTARLFDKLVNLLYTEDYTVKVEEPKHGVIVTDTKILKQYLNPVIRLKLVVADGKVIVTGEINSNLKTAYGSEPTFEPVVNRGMKGSVYRVAWNEMDRVARLIGTTTYEK